MFGEEPNVYVFQVTTRREEVRVSESEGAAAVTDRAAMAANATPTEAPFRIPELTAAEVRASAACMEKRELFTYVLCSVATLAAALVLTLIPRLLIAPCKRRRREAEEAAAGRLARRCRASCSRFGTMLSLTDSPALNGFSATPNVNTTRKTVCPDSLPPSYS